MEVAEITRRKSYGDMTAAAAAVGITPENANRALTRVNSKHHDAIVKALTTILVIRELMSPEKSESNG